MFYSRVDFIKFRAAIGKLIETFKFLEENLAIHKWIRGE
jgi:hypothetical protein